MRTASVLVILLSMCTLAAAQDTVANIKNSTLDTSVPESPAFTVLGLTPTTVTRPATPRALASSLLNGFDQNGNFQSGIALDTAPYMLFYGNNITLQDYQKSHLLQFLARTQFSFATTKGATESDKSAKLAAGLNIVIFDKGDPRTNPEFVIKLAGVASNVLAGQSPLSPNASQAERDKRKQDIEAQVEKAAKPIRDDFQKRSWNRSSWVVAGAPSWISKDGTTAHMAPNGAAVWSSLAYGFENVPGLKDNAQVIIHARFHSNENVPDPQNTGKFYRQQSTVTGARIRFGKESTIGSFETAYVHTRPVGRPTDNYFRLTVGAEKRLADNLWLHFGIGGESGAKNGQNKLFVLGTFKWGTGPKSN
jgi:hypothetical protein